MIINIRQSVFETNSSSVHSICISKEKPKILPSRIIFRIGEYGWDNESVYNTQDYLYTIICSMENDVKKKYLGEIERILNKNGIDVGFVEPAEGWYGIDHVSEAFDFVTTVLLDEDALLRFLFSPNSVVYTGNDGEDGDEDCYAGEPKIWNSNKHEFIDNPKYDPEHFDYYVKGN